MAKHEQDAQVILALCTSLDQETRFMVLESGDRRTSIELYAGL